MIPLLVLRPEPGNARTVAAAQAAGWRAVGAPLFAIHAVEADLSAIASPDALLLTSANAAGALGAGAVATTLPVYAVGEATAAAARAAGFGRVVVGEADAAAIVARAAADGVRRLLHLAGREHRAVAHPAVTIERRIVYASEAVDRLPAAAAAALRDGAVALLHSPRAAETFARLVDAAGLERPPMAALSPAVADAAGRDWPALAIAERPTDAALLAAAARLCEGAGDAYAARR